MTILKKVNGKKLSFNHEVKVSRKMAKMLSVYNAKTQQNIIRKECFIFHTTQWKSHHF